MDRARRALSALESDPATLGHVFQEACLDICEAVGATRASIWFFNAAGDTLTCDRLYDCRTGTVSSGGIVREADVPAYFDALRKHGAVRADDANTHPATQGFQNNYFVATGIRSLLDHVIFAGSQPVSVLCAEACGDGRIWTDGDQTYLAQMAILLGIAIQDRRSRYVG